MFFDQRDEDLVSERTRLAEPWVGPNRDALFGIAGIDAYLARARRGAFLIVAEKRASDAEQIVFYVELAGRFGFVRRSLPGDHFSRHRVIIRGACRREWRPLGRNC